MKEIRVTADHIARAELRLGYIRKNDGEPDASWTLDHLAEFVAGEFTDARRANEEALLHAHKSAVHLFRAGCALKLARDKCKAEGHGRWTRWLDDSKLAISTVSEAIKLYENAKTEDALLGLGITEAKEKFVYPATERQEGHDKRDERGQERKSSAGRQRRAARSGEDRDQENGRRDDGETDREAAQHLVDEVEGIAQRMTEIALTEVGKVRWSKQTMDQLLSAAQAMNAAIRGVSEKIEGMQSDD